MLQKSAKVKLKLKDYNYKIILHQEELHAYIQGISGKKLINVMWQPESSQSHAEPSSNVGHQLHWHKQKMMASCNAIDCIELNVIAYS